MKLLLTSSGLSNRSIGDALRTLLAKPTDQVKLAFVPTAANVEPGSKDWLINDLNNLVAAGFEVDIVDISAVANGIWLPRLESAEVLFFGGGNTFHLMHWMRKSGLIEMLPELLKNRIYAGISAGSCIAGPTIYNAVQNLFGEKYELEIKEGLGLVDFQIVPHLNSPYFEEVREANIEIASKELAEPVYAIDDNSAVMVNDGKVEVVSEGIWHRYN